MSDPGIIWVASGIIKPDVLTPDNFADWYENIHIDEVISTGGVSAAARYESILVPLNTNPTAVLKSSESSAPTRTLIPFNVPWLTIYEMPSVAFRHTPRFKGLDGQKAPKGNLLNEIFLNAVFATRFSRRIYLHSEEGVQSGAAPIIFSAYVPPSLIKGKSEESLEVSDADAEAYSQALHKEVVKLPGLLRLRVLKTEDSSVLEAFQRHPGKEGLQVLIEFGEQNPPQWDDVAKVLKLDDGECELGAFKLKRTYGNFAN